MTSRLTETVIDAGDPAGLADFWCAVLGYAVLEKSTGHVEIGTAGIPAEQLLAAARAGAVVPSLVFVQAVSPKHGKNRLHLDVSPIDRSQAEEVARLLSLGAHRVDIGQGDQPWVVLADPEGNEFCVLRSLAPGEFEL